MGNTKDVLNVAIANYMRNEMTMDVWKVEDVDEEVETGGYCESCYYEETVLTIVYVDNEGKTHKYTHHSNFAELINALD